MKEAGFTEQQAEALAAAEAELFEENFATKRDIAEIKRDIKALEVTLRRDMEEMDTRLARDMRDLEYRMTIKLGAIPVVAVGAMAALGKVLKLVDLIGFERPLLSLLSTS